MRRHRSFLVPCLVLMVLALSSILAACDKGPEADLHLKRVIIVVRWEDPPSFRAIDPQGREYDFVVDADTVINSGQAEEFTFDDIILGDDLEIWGNEILVTPEPEYPRYRAVRIDIAPTTR